MNFLELFDISERIIELVNPTSPEKIRTIGQMAGLQPGQRVIEFGCGYGEVLKLWAEQFGISGIGIELREKAVIRARQKMAANGLADRIEIVHASGAEYQHPLQAFDLAACVGASFIWGGYRQALQALRRAMHPNGKIIIGEPFWQQANVPPEFAQNQADIHTRLQLWQISREEGFDIMYMLAASPDDWDRYEAANWYGLVQWLEENPEHPERGDVIQRLHNSQEEYFRYGREHFGWALFLLNPIHYRQEG